MYNKDDLLNSLEESINNKDLDKLIELSSILLKEYKKLNKRFDRVITQSDIQQREVLKLSEKLEQKNLKLKSLLDNTSQGFLQFDKNMKIDAEYSKQVEEIFKEKVENKDITTLLYKNKEKADKLKENLLYVLNNPQNEEIILSLLEKEFIINNKFIEVEYKVLKNNNFMLILNDITEKKELQKKAEIEKQILKMVVEVVVNKEDSLELIEKYKNFINNIDKSDKDTIKRELHTFKGSFAQKEFIHTPFIIHEVETTMNLDKEYLLKALNKDIEILENILGKEFFKTNYVLIEKNRLDNVINEIKNYTNDLNIINLINTLKYFNVKNYFRKYKNLLNQLSVKLEKPIKIDFEIEDIYLDNKFKPFLDSLVHIFKNSLDHGIESIEERILNDKDEFGYIKCKVYIKNSYLVVEIEDDGNGIDIEKIKQKAIKKGIINQKNLKYIDNIHLINLIFNKDFSTKENITPISGRGVGLNVVQNEIKKLNGYIKLTQNPTIFSFFIPIDLDQAIYEFLMNTNIYIKEFIGEIKDIQKVEFIKQKYCSSIQIDDYIFYITSNKIDTKILKELLNIIGGYFLSQFSKTNLSIPQIKCVNKIANGIKIGDIILSFKRINNEY